MAESGVFMSSFTATIFITAVATIGVLIITMLIAVTVMLESCQSSGSGVLDDVKKSEQHDYCSLFDFHAELNNLEASEFPMICKSNALHFIQGRYLQNLNASLWFVEEYFSTLKPDDDGLDVILLDADDILSLIGNFSRISSIDW